jgi:transcriptional regulator with XRE-family HTH domain
VTRGGDSLAERIVRFRVQAGLSQEQLAVAAGVSAQAISDIERGITLHPRAGTIHRVADGLGPSWHFDPPRASRGL